VRRTAYEVCIYSWEVQSHGLFPREFGAVVFDVRGGEKHSDQNQNLFLILVSRICSRLTKWTVETQHSLRDIGQIN